MLSFSAAHPHVRALSGVLAEGKLEADLEFFEGLDDEAGIEAKLPDEVVDDLLLFVVEFLHQLRNKMSCRVKEEAAVACRHSRLRAYHCSDFIRGDSNGGTVCREGTQRAEPYPILVVFVSCLLFIFLIGPRRWLLVMRAARHFDPQVIV